MNNIQEMLNNINDTWGKVRPCDYGRIRRVLVFRNGVLLSSHIIHSEITKLYGLHETTINQLLNGRCKVSEKGYILRFHDSWDGVIPLMKPHSKKSRAKYKVEVFKDGISHGEFIGYSEVIQKFNIDPGTLAKIRKGEGTSSKGYTFKFTKID